MVDLICDILLSYYHDFNIVMYPEWNNNVLFNIAIETSDSNWYSIIKWSQIN